MGNAHPKHAEANGTYDGRDPHRHSHHRRKGKHGRYASTTLAVEGTTVLISDTNGPCWNYDKVYDAELPVFNSTLSKIKEGPVLYFVEGVWFHMANVTLLNWTQPWNNDNIDRENKTYGKDQFDNQWDHNNDHNTNRKKGPYRTEQHAFAEASPNDNFYDWAYLTDQADDGHAAFYRFEEYRPAAGEYPGRADKTMPVILIFAVQVLKVFNPQLATKGYLVMASNNPYKSYMVSTRAQAVAMEARYGIVGTEAGINKQSVVLAYCDNTLTTPLQLSLYALDGNIYNAALASADVSYNSVTMITTGTVSTDVQWALVLPLNVRGTKDAANTDMDDLNLDDAVQTYLLNRCMGIDKEPPETSGAASKSSPASKSGPASGPASGPGSAFKDDVCSTGFSSCTKFFSNTTSGLTCQDAAKLSKSAATNAYKAVCGMKMDQKGPNPLYAKNTTKWQAYAPALATPDCACINYTQSTFKQPGLFNKDYEEYMAWKQAMLIPDLGSPDGHCWWPSCSNHDNSLTVDEYMPTTTGITCPDSINCISALSGIDLTDHSSLNIAIQQKCGGIGDGDTGQQPGGAGEPGPANLFPHGAPEPAPTPPMDLLKNPALWPKQSWFIPTIAAMAVLIVGGLVYWLVSNRKTTTTVTTTKK